MVNEATYMFDWKDSRFKKSPVSGGPSYDGDAVDNTKASKENESMTAMTREEMTARLELVEAKSDARLARFEERIDVSLEAMRTQAKELKDDLKQDQSARKTELEQDKAARKIELSSLKLTMITTGIAVVIGLWAANTSMVQTMIAAFESGKGTATAITQATEQLKQTQDQLKNIQAALEQQAKEAKEAKEIKK